MGEGDRETMSIIGNVGPYVDSEEDFESYCSRVKLFFDAHSVKAGKKACTFLTVVGARIFSLVKDLVAPKNPAECTYEELVTALKSYYRLQIYERFKFYSCNQESGESISKFVAAIKARARTCEFGANLDDMLRDRLVMDYGIKLPKELY